jgi:hypothetical protein
VSMFAVFALTIGLADLVRGLKPRGIPYAVPIAAGAVVAVLLAVAAALNTTADLALLAVIGVVLVGWVVLADRALSRPTSAAWAGAALATLGAGAAIMVASSGAASSVAGSLADWYRWTAIPRVPGMTVDRAVLIAGLFVVQFATGNLLVRLSLCRVGAPTPSEVPQEQTKAEGEEAKAAREPANRLKGGRLIGPMERVFIMGLGLAGEFTAAGVVVAAKGLIRWPELQAVREGDPDSGIDAVTEYFLVGSFVSWLVALASLGLARVI